MINSKLINAICGKYGTPVYVYFESTLKGNYEFIRDSFSNKYNKTQIAYSMKNCYIPGIIKSLEQYKPMYEVTSLNEMLLLKKLGINLSRCVYTNFYKSDNSLEYAIKNDLGYYAIDSCSDLKRLKRISSKLNKKVNVLLRVNPAIDIRDTVFASAVPCSKTGAEICKDHPDCAENLLVEINKIEKLRLKGIHGHIGSQVTSIEYYEKFIDSIVRFFTEMSDKYSIEMDIIDLGGGYPVMYNPKEEIASVDEISDVIINCVKRYGINPTIMLETGRFITSNAGILVTKVVGTKYNPNIGKIVVIDASMYTHLLDSILADWYFEIEKLESSENTLEEVCIVGCTNDTLDHLDPSKKEICPECNKEISKIRKRMLVSVAEGDILIIKGAGAYTTCFNNNYCLLPAPAILMISINNEIIELRRQEDFYHMFSLFVSEVC